MTSIIVNLVVILFEVEERHVAGTSYNKFGFILKTIGVNLIVNYRQFTRLYCLRLKSDTSLETSYNKFGFILKTISVNLIVNYCQFNGYIV
jgi:hypothetical protein